MQATRVIHMRSRLGRARSRAVVDRQRKLSRSVLVKCALYCEDHGRQLMAYALRGVARAGLQKRDPVEALSNGGTVAEPLAWDSLRGNKPRGSTGGCPWFGMCNDMQLALAICGAICTGRFLPWAVERPVPVQMWEGRADSVPDNVGGVSPVIVEHAPGASHVSVRRWDGMHPVLLHCCCSADAAVGGSELRAVSKCGCGRGEPSRTVAVGGGQPSPVADLGIGRGRADQPQGNVARVSPVPVHCMLLTGVP